MRPIRLEVEGLTSLASAQVIPFDQLDGLFAITGPTGAGKSSLLDAMSLALFGELPRGGREYREFISLGRPHARLRFEFEAQGVRYVVVRRMPRTGNQAATFERIESDGTQSPVVPDGGIVDIRRAVERVLGFDYKTFARVVLLPQGEFAELLRGSREERQRIFTRLLDGEKYERAGRLARERGTAARTEAGLQEELREREYADATDERLATLVREAATARARGEAVAAALVDLRGWGERLVALAAEEPRLTRLARGVESIEGERVALAASLAGIEPEGAATAVAIERAARELEAAREGVAAAASELERVLALRGDEGTLGAARGAAGERMAALRERGEREGERKRAEAALTAARGEVEEAVATVARATEGEGVARARVEVARGGEQQARAGVEAAERRERLERERGEAGARAAAAAAAVSVAAGTHGEALERLAAARAELEAAVHAHHVAALAAGLGVGEPCPVCVRPLDAVVQVDAAGTAEIDRAREAVGVAERQGAAAAAALRESERASAAAHGVVEGLDAQIAAAGVSGDVTAARAVATVAHETRLAAERAAAEAASARQVAERRRSAAEAAVAAREAEVAALAAAHERAGARLATAEAALAALWPDDIPDDAEAQLEGTLAEIRRARTAVSEAAERERRARSEHERAERARRDWSARQGEVAAGLERQLGRLATAAETVGEAVGAVLDLDLAVGAEPAVRLVALEAGVAACGRALQGRLAGVSAERAETAERMRERLAALGGATARVPDLAVALELLEEDGRATASRGAHLAEQLRVLRGRVKARAEMERRIAELRERSERYLRVAGELRRDRFVKFLLEESFQELAVRASAELQLLSGGRYSMLAEGSDFAVVDHHNADERRSVATFSGGESFLASLALAMALSQGIRDLAGDAAGARLESVFIDEGFGTLDPSTLDTVVESLERLQQTGRMIGIITHVEGLAERIPSGLVVEPSGSGSTVRVRS